VSRAAIGLDEIRKRLPADSALVSLVRYDRQVFAPVSQTAAPRRTRVVPSYLGFVLRSDGSDPIVVPLGPAAAIDAAVARWRRAMIAEMASDSSGQQPEPSLNATGVGLRRQIWDPIAAQVGNAARVFVVPDGAFNLVPLAALPSGRGRYLVEDGPIIHYLSAERDLVLDETTPKPSSAGLLSVGGASFSDGSSFAALRRSSSREAPTLSASALRDASINCGGFRSMRFAPIPESRNEAQAVAGLWRQFGAGQGIEPATLQTLLGPAATERAFKQTAPGRRILHLATHGFFLGDDCAPVIEGSRAVGGLTGPASPASKPAGAARVTGPRAIPENPLLLSGLALAGANRRAAARADEDDGILSAEEVAGLNLAGVEWAVLSACDTGLGTVVSREGVLGLRRAFQVAGVRTVIMSLWSVDDRATLEWMERLYESRFRENLSTVDAMRNASVRVIRDRRSKGLSTNPFYWAAFVASGDWR
jgi:CHAT domain-containing protein